jgi:hypothetical protein
MPNNPPPWLATMQQIDGINAARDNAIIVGWADKIGQLFPGMARYCSTYTNDTIAWCGLTVGYCMAVNGIQPVFGATDTDKFLWALAWQQFGAHVDAPQPGDVLIFKFSPTDHHVTLYENTEGDAYVCHGGNQSHAVRVSNYPISQCIDIRRPPAPAPAVAAAVLAPTAQMFSGIIATVFGGASDPNKSAYDEHVINDFELGVALPYRFPGARPNVCVWNNGKSVVCKIVDVGPWNTNDPYWQTGTRPQAESEQTSKTRPTNGAGIDLTPAAAKSIGIDGKGIVDWEFADPSAVPETDPVSAFLNQIQASARPETNMANAAPSPGPATPTPGQPDLTAFIQQVIKLIQAFNPPPVKGGTPTTGTLTQDQVTQIQQTIAMLGQLLGSQGGLGPVNGALGQAIGNLLNGKKSAIGIIGALITAVLQVVGPNVQMSSIIPLITSGSLGQVALPIFLAIAAWGILGKFEKWAPVAQPTAPASKPGS